MRILIDTGASSNYCQPGILSNEIILPIKKRACTVNGEIIIDSFHEVSIFGTITRFYIINNLEYDGLIGSNLLNRVNAKINFETRTLVYNNKTEKIYFNDSNKLNHIKENSTSDLEKSILEKIQSLHQNIDTTLPFRTDVFAEIRNSFEKPVCASSIHTLLLQTIL